MGSNGIDQVPTDDDYKTAKEHKLKVLQLHNKILETKADYLKALKQHYENYWLKLDLKTHDSVLDSIYSKDILDAYQSSTKRLDHLHRQVTEANDKLTEKAQAAEERLSQFNKLDPDLLAEFKRLKDDLECQELLFEMVDDTTYLRML